MYLSLLDSKFSKLTLLMIIYLIFITSFWRSIVVVEVRHNVKLGK